MLKRIQKLVEHLFSTLQKVASFTSEKTPRPTPEKNKNQRRRSPQNNASNTRGSTPPKRSRDQENERPARNPQKRTNDKKQSAPKPEGRPVKPQSFEKPKLPLPALVVPPEQEGKVRFCDLNLHDEVLAGIQDLKFEYGTPVQAQVIPFFMQKNDIVGKSQTGTGKTAAFLASIFDRFIRNPEPNRKPGTCRALVLAPTRELAIQIHKDAEAIGKYTSCINYVVFGGMDHRKQMETLAHTPIDILIGTPGRLIDYMRGGQLKLSDTEILVIDEADRMLDMGFIPDVTRIVSRMKPVGTRQTLFFSATFTPEVMRLAQRWLLNPKTVEIQADHVVTDLITQKFYSVLREDKFKLLCWFLKNEPYERVLVFGNRKDFNADLCHKLQKMKIKCDLLSGDVPQEKRLKVLERFRNGQTKILVATDVAARGIHVDGISHVINYDLPVQAEDYVHRIGRTGRAGAKGTSISFVCEYGAYVIDDIEKFIGNKIVSIQPESEMLADPSA